METEKDARQENEQTTGKSGKGIIIAARERGPGPGRYGLPSTLGYIDHDFTKHMKPAHSFGQRLGSLMAKDCSPGPAHFIDPRHTRHGKDGTPSYSMLARPKDPNFFKTPGPGRYENEKAHPQGEKHAPVYSMGARTRFRKSDKNPASNVYSLPQLIGPAQPNKRSYPSYSMTARRNVGHFAEDLSKTPGPGRYDALNPNTWRNKAPIYGLQSRHYMPGDTTVKPGPGAHRPERVTVHKPTPPKHSLGVRHSEFVCPLIVPCSD
ncbi:outer dense fiber protein 3 [Lingula anatina]|uniref:Outer dense fiber protein 3 n=1 Tax=Lingula anatina TaxID=7574 RepID=A0A1S3HI62_LINAN|nr:outer dense fiber protein 3 [Lingula anatina]|eukprot:XP_013384679.1 outer dense fiber protein 3 [Lingula anatina]